VVFANGMGCAELGLGRLGIVKDYGRGLGWRVDIIYTVVEWDWGSKIGLLRGCDGV